MTKAQSQERKPSFGSALNQARLRKGMSMRQLADASGLAVGQIHKLEHDLVKKINPVHVAALAEALGVQRLHFYFAAGFDGAMALSHLHPELVRRLTELPPGRQKRLIEAIDELDIYDNANWDGPHVLNYSVASNHPMAKKDTEPFDDGAWSAFADLPRSTLREIAEVVANQIADEGRASWDEAYDRVMEKSKGAHHGR